MSNRRATILVAQIIIGLDRVLRIQAGIRVLLGRLSQDQIVQTRPHQFLTFGGMIDDRKPFDTDTVACSFPSTYEGQIWEIRIGVRLGVKCDLNVVLPWWRLSQGEV